MGKNNLRVLIVDDEIQITILLSEFLNAQGISSMTASNGLDALQKLECSKFNLVITDFNMPLMNGLELIKKIRDKDRYSAIKIILTTGKVHGRGLCRAQSLSDEMLYKPFDLHKLNNIIETLH